MKKEYKKKIQFKLKLDKKIKNLIKKLLKVNPSSRASTQAILADKLFDQFKIV